jgi:triphosphoribosyl-dephospho-CoA synthase
MMAASVIAQWIRRACVLEATARKPGNVHPEASFADLTYADFVKSADVIAPILAEAEQVGVGETIFRAALATRQEVGTNSNLGILLMLTPLAAVPLGVKLEEGIPKVLSGLTRDDALWVYRAINLAQPGGMGEVAEGDVSGEPTGTLLEMMRLAAERDRIASEYASGFSITLNFAAPFLAGFLFGRDLTERQLEEAIIYLHLELMAEYPDTLIARKCGPAIAEESARRARRMLAAGPLVIPDAIQRLNEFDAWLREDGHRRNPGTTADLVAASLFAFLREQESWGPRQKGEDRGNTNA